MKRYQYIENFPDVRGYEYPVIADYGEDGPQPGKDAVLAYAFFIAGRHIGIREFDPGDLIPWNGYALAEFDDLVDALNYLAGEIAERASIAPWEPFRMGGE